MDSHRSSPSLSFGMLLRNEMHHRGFLKFLLSSVRHLIVGKYDTGSICSLRIICEILPGFFHFCETTRIIKI